jgi:predicted nucleic acid-binding protein
MESVYLETTVISYLVSHRSRNLLTAAHQQLTQRWWNERRGQFDCYVSQVVLDEVSAGDPDEARKRLEAISDFQVLEITQEAEFLITQIILSGVISLRAARDAAHIAVATINGIDYLLTWNCAHLANAQIQRRLSIVLGKEGYSIPVICTPEELMGE